MGEHDEPRTVLPEPQATPTVEGEARQGRAARTVKRLLVLVLLVALAAGGAYLAMTLGARRSAEASLAEASEILAAAEDDLLIVDEAVLAGIPAEVATQTVDVVALAGEVGEQAVEASEIIDRARADLPGELAPLADALQESAEARAEMMEAAPAILEAGLAAAAAMSHADQALAEIKAAEDLSGQAVIEFNKHTADGVKASEGLSAQAEAKLQSARSLFSSAAEAFPGADFAAFGAYVEAKIGLIVMAKEIDALWLSGDVSGSNARLAAYNQRDVEVVAMAQALPASVRDPIADAYTAATAEASARYLEARERARSAGEKVSAVRESKPEE